MKCSSIIQELTNWAIDRPDASLPEGLQAHLEECPRCRAEWESIRGWTKLLRPQEEDAWSPGDDFFKRLTEQAMLEKRRAALTKSTRRDLALDVSGWLAVFQQPVYRWMPSLALVLFIVLPSGWWIHHAYSTIGEFEYSSGRVIARADDPLDPREGMELKRNTFVQTPQNAESIVRLESGAEVCVAPLSRVTFVDAHTVRLDHGKAYFDISKQKSGFVVQLPQGDVVVLGTAFQISVHQVESTVMVTRGIVRVSNINTSVRVESGMESVVAAGRTPTKPQRIQSQRLLSTTRWVGQMRERHNQEELRKYYPSLAAPTPKESRP